MKNTSLVCISYSILLFCKFFNIKDDKSERMLYNNSYMNQKKESIILEIVIKTLRNLIQRLYHRFFHDRSRCDHSSCGNLYPGPRKRRLVGLPRHRDPYGHRYGLIPSKAKKGRTMHLHCPALLFILRFGFRLEFPLGVLLGILLGGLLEFPLEVLRLRKGRRALP